MNKGADHARIGYLLGILHSLNTYAAKSTELEAAKIKLEQKIATLINQLTKET